jgi:hypothetical protein
MGHSYWSSTYQRKGSNWTMLPTSIQGKRHVFTKFHWFSIHTNDKYDIILGRGLLQAIGLDIHYSTLIHTWKYICHCGT